MPLYSLLRPLAFALDAETAHRATIGALKLAPNRRPPEFPSSLRRTLAGIEFPSPVGLAAGLRQGRRSAGADARARLRLRRGRHGHAAAAAGQSEAAAVPARARTERSSTGWASTMRASRPLSSGCSAAAHARGVIGVNIGANKDSTDRIADYVARRPRDVAGRALPHDQHQFAEHAGPAPAAGRGRAEGAASARSTRRASGRPADLPESRARSRRRRAGPDRPRRDAVSDRRDHRLEHDRVAAAAQVALSRASRAACRAHR